MKTEHMPLPIPLIQTNLCMEYLALRGNIYTLNKQSDKFYSIHCFISLGPSHSVFFDWYDSQTALQIQFSHTDLLAQVDPLKGATDPKRGQNDQRGKKLEAYNKPFRIIPTNFPGIHVWYALQSCTDGWHICVWAEDEIGCGLRASAIGTVIGLTQHQRCWVICSELRVLHHSLYHMEKSWLDCLKIFPCWLEPNLRERPTAQQDLDTLGNP